MLIEFRTENHRSIREEQVISMEAMKRLGDADDPRPRCIDGYRNSLLPVAAIYGANASGKSNMLSAMGFMREAVLHSHNKWNPEGGINRDPFAWGTGNEHPSFFEVIILVDGIKYQYGFELNDEQITEEWLFAWPKGHKQKWFTRENDNYSFGEHLTGDRELIKRNTRMNSLFLSTAVQNNNEVVLPVFRWFQRLQIIRVGTGSNRVKSKEFYIPVQFAIATFLSEGITNQSRQNFMEKTGVNSQLIDRFKDLMKKADVGICDFRVVKKEIIEEGVRKELELIEFKHDKDDENSWLPETEQSSGTKTWISLSFFMLLALTHGKTIVVDEIESKLHPLLVMEIIKAFNDPLSNPKNAQLVFSTHDPKLLGPLFDQPALRRDQIWLTEKNQSGETQITPLTNFKARKNENIEFGYLQGRFGAIPFLNNLGKFDWESYDEPLGKNASRGEKAPKSID
ncbi:MAG: hypothetical protein RJA81_2183 [Planctomycetota bacterium]|jgi:AAA15 family ATPase/GTPase